MTPLVREWAGVERTFHLDFGRICDLEEACGDVGIGAIYLRLGAHQYHAKYVFHTIRLALIGGGLKPIEAKLLMQERFDNRPMVENVETALDILISVMDGLSPDERLEAEKGDPEEPIPFGAVAANFTKIGIDPETLRRIGYADFIAILQALRDSDTERPIAPPTEEEYEDMIARLSSRARENG